MITEEDLLQARLEQLEAGVPLAECQKDLPLDQAEMLALATSLREMGYPARNRGSCRNSVIAWLKRSKRSNL
ncbi:MAG: hypothetical protein IPL78_22215 [Chloroflexi bacterium]|nr:hypothetical protein [Chloroflexota bacterium]